MTHELRSSTLINNSLISGIVDGDTSTTSLSSTAQWVADTMSAVAAGPPYDDTGMTKLRVGWSSDSSDESSDEEECDNVLEQVQAAAATAHEALTNKESVNVSIRCHCSLYVCMGRSMVIPAPCNMIRHQISHFHQ